MQQSNKWEYYLHRVEFSYNNNYHTSLKMSPFEVIYGYKCRTPINWKKLKAKFMLGLDMLKWMEGTVKKVRMNLKAAQDRQKAYIDKKWSYQEFQVGDHVYVRMKPKRGICVGGVVPSWLADFVAHFKFWLELGRWPIN